MSGTRPFHFGVIDECGKINLNAMMKLDPSGQILHDVLMKLPNMTEDIANSILDWLDPDDDPRTNGAENEYYSTLTPPYRTKNGPLDSLEELLLVKGVTPQLLFGNDRNRNGVLDPDENDGSGAVDRGWSAYLTVYSRERNIDADGNPRIYVNDSDLTTLYNNLNTAVGQDLASYIIAYRLYGAAGPQSGPGAMPQSSPRPNGSQPSPGGGNQPGSQNPGGNNRGGGPSPAPSPPGGGGFPSAGGGGGGARPSAPTGGPTVGAGPSQGSSGRTGAGTGGTPGRLTISTLGNFQQGGQPRRIASLYELVNSEVEIPSDDPQAPPTRYPSPLNDTGAVRQLLPLLLDKVTTVRGTELPGRINVNTAPQAVLATLPNLTDNDVQSILDHRPDPSAAEPPDPIFQTPAWLMTEANFSQKTLQSIERYVTARSQVYRVQSLGYFDGGGPTSRVEAVIDTNGGRPRIVYWRDLTELGKGFDVQSNP
jgi:type II secretory pathway component PulK